MRASACLKNKMTKNRRNTEKKGIKYQMSRREENGGRGKVREGIE
jgi:hypothetical protein